MKLVDFVVNADPKDFENKSFMTGQSLKNSEKQLFECEEFKNVARINFLDLPNYLVDNETGEPISASREFLGGDTVVKQVQSYKIYPNQEWKFNKIVDLYSIAIAKIYTKTEDINKPGVWVYPTTYNPETFTQKHQIRVIWDQQQLEQTLTAIGSDETPKERLLRMFKNALESMEPNLPCEYALLIRCSERSTSLITEDVQPSQELPVNTMDSGDAGPM